MAAQNLYPTASVVVQHSVDLKANGEVSRMRNHKGNMPSLPQTKYCTLCPAKFTRTTHLNRHLRSHTNERLHRCNFCHAEFTRSDLLTRHKRTCGDTVNVNRSRRKSCQACAESKVKCNLQFPCSKCSSRGRECIFINDPEASRNKKKAKKSSQLSASPTSTVAIGSPVSSLGAVVASPPPTPSSIFTSEFIPIGPTMSPVSPLLVAFPISETSPFELPSLSNSSGSSSSSSHSSPRSDFFEAQPNFVESFDMGFDTPLLDTHLTRLFSHNTFDPFFEQAFPPSSPQSGGTNEFTWFEGSEFYAGYGTDLPSPFSQTVRYDQINYATLKPNSNITVSPRKWLDLLPPPISRSSASVTGSSELPAAELDHYLYLFFSEFSTQIPLIHPSTWQIEDKPLILIRAMQACGALFVKTRKAMNFITETLAFTRDTLIQTFTKASSDAREQLNLILAVILLQTIGLFHQRADQRVSSNVYHGMLVMMIRCTGLIGRIGSWVLPDLNDVQSLNAAWRDWATCETIKRALFLSYLHDCCHCMYFALSPSFQPAEFDINLPCDNALWLAGTASDWLELSKGPSAYGIGQTRISGFSMKRALVMLHEIHLPAVPPALNSFAHFILIHTILRDLYASRTVDAPAEVTPPMSPDSDGRIIVNKGGKDETFEIQLALNNWLKMWLNGPESMQVENNEEEPSFARNALPFYWLAQASLIVLYDGAPNVSGKTSNARAEGRFRLMTHWLEHIRLCLRSGTPTQTQLWDELVKIQVQLSQDGAQASDEYPHGLLGFFGKIDP